MNVSDTEIYSYKNALIQVVWFVHQEVYHWYVFVERECRGDSLKNQGYETVEAALFEAKRHADWTLDDCEDL